MDKANILKGLALVVMAFVLTGCDPFGKFMQKHGWTVLLTARKERPTAQLWHFDGSKEDRVVATVDDCFPGLGASIRTTQIQLPDNKRRSAIAINAAVNYLPVPISGGTDLKNTKEFEITFGATNSHELSDVAFVKYLESHQITGTCLERLRNPENRVLLAAAEVAQLTYKLRSTSGGDVKADVSMLTKALGVAGVQFSSDDTTTIEIKEPMFLAYKAYQFKELVNLAEEERSVVVTLKKGSFSLGPLAVEHRVKR